MSIARQGEFLSQLSNTIVGFVRSLENYKDPRSFATTLYQLLNSNDSGNINCPELYFLWVRYLVLIWLDKDMMYYSAKKEMRVCYQALQDEIFAINKSIVSRISIDHNSHLNSAELNLINSVDAKLQDLKQKQLDILRTPARYSLPSSQPTLIFCDENHYSKNLMAVLVKLIPHLKKRGFNDFYMEMPPECDANLQEASSSGRMSDFNNCQRLLPGVITILQHPSLRVTSLEEVFATQEMQLLLNKEHIPLNYIEGIIRNYNKLFDEILVNNTDVTLSQLLKLEFQSSDSENIAAANHYPDPP